MMIPTIRRVLDQGRPETPCTPDIFTSKVQLVFDHALTTYGEGGKSAYTARGDFRSPVQGPEHAGPLDLNRIADDVVARIHNAPAFALILRRSWASRTFGDPLMTLTLGPALQLGDSL